MIPPPLLSLFFFFNDTATTEIYTLSLHDALPILFCGRGVARCFPRRADAPAGRAEDGFQFAGVVQRSEEHTSELQSHLNLVCRLLLEKKKKKIQKKVHIGYKKYDWTVDSDASGRV